MVVVVVGDRRQGEKEQENQRSFVQWQLRKAKEGVRRDKLPSLENSLVGGMLRCRL